MNDLIKAIALGVVRNGAALAGGWLVSHGVASGADEQSFVGSVCFLAALGFTAWDKLAVKRKIGAALATPAPGSTSAAAASVIGG
jgi:hypothetical protein